MHAVSESDDRIRGHVDGGRGEIRYVCVQELGLDYGKGHVNKDDIVSGKHIQITQPKRRVETSLSGINPSVSRPRIATKTKPARILVLFVCAPF